MDKNEEFFFPACENVEKKEDKKVWYWADCLKVAQASGAKAGTLEFWLIYKYRVYETHGRYGFCAAGFETLALDLGVSVEQVKIAHQNACCMGGQSNGRSKRPKLYHIWCDKKVYRNKAKIYVTEQWLKDRGLSVEQIRVLAYGRSNTHKITGKVAENGEIIDAEIVKNETETKYENVETKYENVETKYENVETKYENVVFPHMNKLKNKCKRMSVKEYLVTKVTSDESQETSSGTEQKESESQPKGNNMDEDLPNNLGALINKPSLKGEEPENVVNKELPPQSPAAPPSREKVRVVDENGQVVGGNPLVERAYELWQEIMGQPCKRDKWNGNAGWNMMRAKNKGENWLKGMLLIARECKKDPKADFRAVHVANLADVQKNQDVLLDWYRKKKLESSSTSGAGLDFLRKITYN